MNVRPWLSHLLSLAIAIVIASSVRAQNTSVTVLGVRSLDAEDQLERRVSQALRSSMKGVEGYRLSDREVSLAQMSLAHGCEDVDLPCLKEIAATLSADRLIYGNLVRSGDKVRVTLFNFDAQTGTVEASAERTVLATQLLDSTLTEIVDGLVQRLVGKPGSATGTLRITGNRPGAEVVLDGNPAGQLGAQGELVIMEVSEGPHSVTVTDAGERRELAIDVRADTTTTLRALLTQPVPKITELPDDAQGEPSPSISPEAKERRLRRILGWSSIGVAAGFAIATIYSWVRIGSIQDSQALQLYALEYPKEGAGTTNDVCKEAVNRNFGRMYASMPNNPELAEQAELEEDAHDLCTEADRLEALQYVFAGGTLLFAGVGTWLLVTGYKKPATTLGVAPSFGTTHASLRATLSF